jgi:outer membrane receptor for ferrienterochelin and colicin
MRVVALAVTLAALLQAGTDGLIEGVVRDRVTGEPIVGAVVTILGTSVGTVTDLQGRYRISPVRAGQYDVRFTYIGYRATVVRAVRVLADLRTTLNAELEPSSVEMEAVEVRAVRPLIQRDLAATAFMVGSEKMALLPVSTVNDVLALQPGTTAEGNVRGGKTTDVVFLIDGLPVMDVLGGGASASVPRSAITGITLQTGGFDAEYGNAQSGVVNIVTRAPSRTTRWVVRHERDNWVGGLNDEHSGWIETEVAGSGPLIGDRLHFFTANVLHTDETRWWQDFQRQVSAPVVTEFSGISKLEWDVGSSDRLSLQAIYSWRRWRDYEFSWRFNLAGLPERERRAGRGTVQYVTSPAMGLTVKGTASLYAQQSKIGDERIGGQPTAYEYDFFLRYIVRGKRHWWSDARQFVWTARVEAVYDGWKDQMWKIGAELHQYDLRSDLQKVEPQRTYFGKPIVGAPLLNFSNGYSYRPRSGSVYVQDKAQVESEGSILTAGIRWDFLDPLACRPIVEFIPTMPGEYRQMVVGDAPATFKQQISPRLSYTAPVGPRVFVFMNVGHYFQFPLFDQLYAGLRPEVIAGSSKNVSAGNPDLQPERTVAWELGLKVSLDDMTVGSVTYYRKRMTNQLDAKTLIPFDSKSAGDYGFAAYVNNAEAKAEGVEVIMTRESGERLRGSLSYTLMFTEGVTEAAEQGINYAQWGFPVAAESYALSWDQRHTIKADAEWSLWNRLHLNAVLLYNSPRPYTYYPTRDGYQQLDTTKAFLPNNRRMGHVWFINFKASLDFPINSQGMLTLFADGRNILGRSNVRWMDSNGRVGGELGDPSATYDPRRVRIGLEMRL